METKLCKCCNKTLPVELFTFNDKSRGYRKSKCKKCRTFEQKDWRKNNPEKHRQSKKNYFAKSPLEKLRNNFRRRIYKVIKNKNFTKNHSINSYLGCSYEELKTHLELKFQPGMTWDNYGKWHIDHIKPLSLGQNISDLENLCHYTNLQPLWAEDNIKKSNSW